MVRRNWINLNGQWDYAFTGSPKEPETYDGKILVPFSPESPLSGVGRQLWPEEYLWYRRSVTVPKPPEGHRLLLHFGAVDQTCTVYINGKEAGSHSGGYLPFSLDITAFIPDPALSDAAAFKMDTSASSEPNASFVSFELLVRVRDLSDTSWYSRGKQKLKRGGMFYTAQSGIWQTVWLEEVPPVYLSSVLAEPDFDNACCRILVQAADTREQMPAAAAQVSPGGSTLAPPEVSAQTIPESPRAAIPSIRAQIRPETDTDRMLRDDPLFSAPCDGLLFEGDARGNGTREGASCDGSTIISLRLLAGKEAIVPLPDFHPWTPEDPYLYHLTLEMDEDRVECYFAMRKCDVQTDEKGFRRIFLNNRPCFQAGVLDQGYWPDGLYTAPCDEAFIYDITEMKKLGFNMLRKHVKLEPQRWYYHCDRLGMLVWQDMVCGGASYRHWFVTYLATLMNAFSITISDGKKSRFLLSRQEEDGRRSFLQEIEETVRALRVHPCIVCWVPFNEGWGQFDAADAAGRISRLDPTRLVDHVSGWFDQGAGDIASIHYYFFSLHVRPEPVRALALTEFGGYSWQIPGHCFGSRLYGYGKYRDKKGLTEGYKKLITDTALPAVRDGISASVYTQLSDIEGEVNGILTYDRKIEKMDAKTVRELNEAMLSQLLQA